MGVGNWDMLYVKAAAKREAFWYRKSDRMRLCARADD